MKEMQWNPGSLLETSGFYWKTCTLHAGVKLDIFTILGNQTRTPEEVAGEMKADKRAVTMLLNALSAMGLIQKTGDSFQNTESSEKFLSKKSPNYIGFMIMHHHHLVDAWSRMDESILTGKPVKNRASHAPEAQRESFLMGMFNIAMAVAPEISKTLDLKGCSRLLDLGGGPGTYAIHFCKENPNLSAMVFDLPTTRPFAEQTIERFEQGGNVSFHAGDFQDSDFKLDEKFDAVWMSHILHGESPEDAQKVVMRAASVMNPGGKIFIHDFFLENTMDAPLFPALFSLNMLLGTDGGQAYSESQVCHMMEKSGFSEIKRLKFKGPTDSGILTGILR